MSGDEPLKPGDRVRKNPATWIPNEFDEWGRGRGVGEVLAEDPKYPLVDLGMVDVRWPNGRCAEPVEQLLKVPPPEPVPCLCGHKSKKHAQGFPCPACGCLHWDDERK